MRGEDKAVTVHATVTLRDATGTPRRRGRRCAVSTLRVQMQFLEADPYAVRLRFSSPGAQDVEWVFARRLLAEGLHQQSGHGDVRIAPLPGSRGTIIAIELTSTSQRVLCEIPIREIGTFIDASTRLVPIGGERQAVDLDSELSALLTTGGA